MGHTKVLAHWAVQQRDWESLYCYISSKLAGYRESARHYETLAWELLYRASPPHFLRLVQQKLIHPYALVSNIFYSSENIKRLANEPNIIAEAENFDRQILRVALNAQEYVEALYSRLTAASNIEPMLAEAMGNTPGTRESLLFDLLIGASNAKNIFELFELRDIIPYEMLLRAFRHHREEWPRLEILNRFLEHGVVLNPLEPLEEDVFYLSLIDRNRSEDMDVFNALIQAGGDPRMSLAPLVHMVASMDDPHLLSKLVAHGCDINRRYMGATALHLFAFYGNSEAIERLINHGADCNLVDNYGHVALILWYIPGYVHFNFKEYEYPIDPYDQKHMTCMDYYREQMWKEEAVRYSDDLQEGFSAPKILFENTPTEYVRAFLETNSSEEARMLFDYIEAERAIVMAT